MFENQSPIMPLAHGVVWTGLIYIYLLVLFVLTLADLPLMGANMKPAFLLMGVYFITLHKPELLPLPLLFVIGVVFDLVAGDVLGLSSLIYLLLALTLHAQRRFLNGQGWMVIWAGYLAASTAAMCLAYLLHAVLSWSWPQITPFLLSLTVGGLFYPLVILPLHIFLRRLHIAKSHHP